jgi:tetratricopeptide (TPR) repeat protein
MMNTLAGIDSYIEDRPDSALAVLVKIDTVKTTTKEKAKYALLLSMALDKNYIDTTTFDILQPAIVYYRKHGSEYDKMRTLYYEGRIYANKHDYASATSCFLKALDCGSESDHAQMRARISVACGIAYDCMYQLERGTEMYEKSVSYFKGLGKDKEEITSYFRIIRNSIVVKDSATCDKYIGLCENMLGRVGHAERYRFYGYRIDYVGSLLKSRDKLLTLIEEYQETVPDSLRDYLDVAIAYYNVEDYPKALDALIEYEKTCPDATTRHDAISALINWKMGQYEEAYTSLMRYVDTNDSIENVASRQEALIMENAHNIELAKIKSVENRNKVIYGITALCTIFILAYFIARYRLRLRNVKNRLLQEEIESSHLQYMQLKKDCDELENICNRNLQDDSVRAALNERITLLNNVLLSYIQSDCEFDRKIDNEIKKLVADKDDFIRKTRLSFYGSHPKFIDKLRECGLTDSEINYCCLYAIGLKGKEIGAYINMKSHYNMSSVIREKLGIDKHETNLGLYIKKLLKSAEE